MKKIILFTILLMSMATIVYGIPTITGFEIGDQKAIWNTTTGGMLAQGFNLSCTNIVGGTDADFCVDGGGAGGNVNGSDIAPSAIILNGSRVSDWSQINLTGGGSSGNVSSIIAGDMIETSGTTDVTVSINRSEFNDSVDILANYTSGNGNITILNKVITLIAVNLAEMDNSVSAFITSSVGALDNFFTKTETNAMLLDINNTLDSKLNITDQRFNETYTAGDGNISIDNVAKTISFTSSVSTWINGLIDNRVTQAFVIALGFVTGDHTTDTNETTNVNVLLSYRTNQSTEECPAGEYSFTYYLNGSPECREDQQGAGGVDTNASTACTEGEYLDGGGRCIGFNVTVGELSNYTAGDGNISINQIAKTISFSSSVSTWINGLIDIRVVLAYIQALGFYSNTETDTAINNNISGLRTELQGNIDDNVTVLDAEDVAIRQSVLDNGTNKVTIGSVGLVTLNMSNVTNLVGVASCAADEKPTNITINNSGVFLTCATDLNTGGAGSGNVSGGGTTKYLIMWENTQNITNSPAYVTAQNDINFTNGIIIGTTSTANLGALRTNSNNLEFYNGTAWLSVSGGAGAADTTCADVDCVFNSGDTGYLTTNLDFASYLSTGNCTAGNIVQNVSINSTGIYVSCVADVDTDTVYDDTNVRASIELNITELNKSIPIDTLNLTNGNDFYSGTQVNESDNDTIYDDTAVRASILANITELNDSLPNSYYLQGQIDAQHLDINSSIFDSNASTACSNGEYLDGGGRCINFNVTVDNRENDTIYDDTNVRASIELNFTELNDSLPDSYYLQGQIDDQHTDINNSIFDTNASTACNDGEHLDGGGTCKDTNNSIDERTASTTYLPTNFTLIAGTQDDGNLTSLQIFKDGSSLNISEASGASPMTLIVNFSNVTDFNTIIIREQYTGSFGHEIFLGVYDCTSGIYEEEYGEITDMANPATENIPVHDPQDHICSGEVSAQLRHDQNGISSHDLFVDYFVLVDGFTSLTTSQHDGLAVRDNCLTNHPDAMCKNGSLTNFTGNVFTDETFFGGWNGSSEYTKGAHTIDSNASTACTNGEYLDGSGLCININNSINEGANYTSDNGNITIFNKVITLIAVDLNEMNNAISAFITNAVSDLVNYFTKTEIDAQHLDINNSIPIDTLNLTNGNDFYTGTQGNESVVDNQREGVNATTQHDGDVSGPYNAILVETSQGLSVTNLTDSVYTSNGTDLMALEINATEKLTAYTNIVFNNTGTVTANISCIIFTSPDSGTTFGICD